MNYDDLTQRGLLHGVNSPLADGLGDAQDTWHETASRATEMADAIETRLAKLIADGGWNGAGAQAYAQTVRSELIDNLRAYALQAGGQHPQGSQATGYDTQVKAVKTAVHSSHATAQAHPIPWDVDPQWKADLPPKPDPDDKPKPGEPAKPDEPVKIRNGHGGVVKEVEKKHWESLLDSTPASAPGYNATFKAGVTGQVHQADQLFEAVGLGTAAKAATRQALGGIVDALEKFAPPPVKAARSSGEDYAGNTGSTPGAGGAGGGGRTPGQTPGRTPDDGPGHHPGGRPDDTPGYDPYDPTQPPVDGTIAGETNGQLPGTGTTPGTGVTGGPDGSYGTGNGYGGLQTGTAAAGVGDGGVGGLGGVGGGGLGSVPSGSGLGAGGLGAGGAGGGVGTVGVGAPGAAGLGSFGGGAGGAGASFAPGGPGGRGLVNPGNVGPVGAGSSGAGGTGTGGAGAGGTGSGGAGVGPTGRRQSDSDEETEQTELDGTWLEEDNSVWGNRAGAPPAEIR